MKEKEKDKAQTNEQNLNKKLVEKLLGENEKEMER